MSDTPVHPPEAGSVAPEAPKPTPRRAKWRRRIVRTLLVLLVLVVAVRVLFAILLPTTINRAAGLYGLNVDYERSELNLLSGDVGLWHLTIRPKPEEGSDEPTAPLARIGYVRGNISTLALLKLRLDVWRAEADGAELTVERLSDGSIPILQRVLDAIPQRSPPPAPPVETADRPRRPLNLTPPIRIDALRLSHATLHVVDRAVQPEFTARLWIDFRLDDLGSPLRPTTIEAAVWSEPGLDLVRVEGSGRALAEEIEAELRVVMHGLRPGSVEQYLRPLGLAAAASVLGGRADLKVRLARSAPPDVDSVSGEITINQATLTDRDGVVAAIERVGVELARVGPSAAEVARVLADGGRISFGRSAKGNFAFAGIELVGAANPRAAPAPTGDAPVESPPPTNASVYRWSLGELVVSNASATFTDDAIEPLARIDADLERLTVTGMAFDPSQPPAVVRVSARGAIPGVVGEVGLDGTVAPFSPDRAIKLALRAGSIRPERLKPYFDALGVESLLKSGELTAELTAGVRAASDGGNPRLDATIADVRFRDEGEDLVLFPRIAVGGARLEPAGAGRTRLSVDSIELVGPQAPMQRDAEGMLAFAGSRRTPGTLARRAGALAEELTDAATEPSPDARGRIALQIPPMSVGRLDWSGIRIGWEDRSTTPPALVGIEDAGLRVENLHIDLSPGSTARPATPGSIRGFVSAPGIANRLEIAGTVEAGAGTLTSQVALSGSGITATALAPYLATIGITPVLEDGQATARATLQLSQREGDRLRASLMLSELRLADGERELAGVDAVRVDGVEFVEHELRIGAVGIDRPRAAVARDDAGALVGGGIRFTPIPPRDQPPIAPTTGATRTPQTLLSMPLGIRLDSLSVSDARLQWDDSAVDLPVSLSVSADLRLTGLRLGNAPGEPKPAPFDARMRIEGAVDSLAASGELVLSARAVSATVLVEGSGIRGEPWAAYFPDGIQPALKDGRLRLRGGAGLRIAEAGGWGIEAHANGLHFADGDRVLARVDEARVSAPRIDPASGVFAVEEISTRGVEADVELQESFSPSLLGVRLVPAPPKEPAAPTALIDAEAAVEESTAPDAVALAAAARRELPHLTLGKLDLALDRLTVHNRAWKDAAPLDLRGIRLRNRNALSWGGPDARNQPATQFEFTGSVRPVAEAIRAEASVAPFAEQPTVKLKLSADGIRGAALGELIPALAERVDGQRLESGRVSADIDLHLSPDRRGGVPDYTRGFGAELTVRDTGLRDGNERVLAGVELVHASGARVEPRSGNVVIRSLEITRPAAVVIRDEQGIEVLGLVVKSFVPPAGDAEPAPTTAPAADVETPASSNAPAAPAGPEYRIDRLTWSGLDLRIEDRTLDPAIVLPIDGFDLDAAGLSTRALVEPRPIRFGLVITSGNAPLPRRTGGGGIVGALGDIGAMIGGHDAPTTAPEFEDREVFSQVAASGRLTLHPQPAGWVKASVSGLELASIRGFASAFGVTLGGGVFDSTLDVRMQPAGDIDARTRLVLTDLQLSEPANGPIVRHLALPAPLDVVIAAVQDADGSITLPIRVPIRQGELRMGEIVGSAVGALGQVLATAVASAPVKAVTGVGAVIGIGGGERKRDEPRVIEIEFAPGDTRIAPGHAAELRRLFEEARRDHRLEITLRHELSAGDVAMADRRANPPAADATAIAARLRRQREELIERRVDLAGRARVQLTVLSEDQAAPVLLELRLLDRQIAQTDSALELIYDQLRPGGQRQSARRARAASLEIAQSRLDGVRDALVSPTGATPRGLSDRVRAVAPSFAPGESDAGGKVIITVIRRNK